MISVDRLAAVPSLGLTYLAGAAGGTRLVTWAHACDLPDPWMWFESGDLVMTTGGGLPLSEDEQVQWITNLIDSNVSALVIAREEHAPAVTHAMLTAADSRRFPVLAASFDLHFVTLARTVIESAVANERFRIASIARLYDVYWQSLHARGSLNDRISALEGATGLTLEIKEASSGEYLARGRAAVRAGSEQGESSDAEVVHTTVPGSSDILLIAGTSTSAPTADRVRLQHLAGLVALELEHHAASRDQLRASGQDLLLGLLDGSISISAVWPELRHRGMTGAVVAACWMVPDAGPLSHEAIHLDARLQQCAPLLTYKDTMLIGLTPNDSRLLAGLAKKLGENCVVGLSAPLKANGDVAEAVRQAQIAASRASSMDVLTVSYDQLEGESGVFPRSVEDTRRLVRRVLGPLHEYDLANDSDLLESVRVFLANDGNWTRSSDQLGVHRQTLVYRLRKVESLSGLKVTSTKGAAMLWLAFGAAEQGRLDIHELLDA